MVNGVKLEDRLDGASNFVSLRIWIMVVLRELELEVYVEENKAMPEDGPNKTIWKWHNDKAMKIINWLCKRSNSSAYRKSHNRIWDVYDYSKLIWNQ